MLKIIKISLMTAVAFSLHTSPTYAVNFGLFGDITYSNSDEAGTNDAFALGGLDFYATHQISEKTRGFVEYVFENTSSGLVTDLERLWISHTFDDRFVIAAGRFHSPLGNWNRAYHHGALLQDTISRPFFLDFEDRTSGILPVHLVGLMANGDFTLSSGELSYELGIGNGPSLNTSTAGFAATIANKPEIEINVTSDTDSNKAIFLRTIYKPDALPLKAALFLMNSAVAESNGTGSAVAAKGSVIVDQTIIGFDLSYESDNGFDVLAEYYNIENTNKVGTAGTYTGKAYYVQLGYWFTETLKGVIRYEDLSFNSNDSYFRVLATAEASHNVFALRYDIDETNSLKFEVDSTDLKTGTDTTTFTVQWAFLIP
ncbi:hypothetical protein MNBD_GAMMA23-2139 [hydrothermal vent metagenome]|uniref:Porin domain-containing protein n=1 Tax=hydrothermal vent metagenome TaxID=652676 RepID=A0A3B1AKL7_9ZZZZ